jgi:hypothetical protein
MRTAGAIPSLVDAVVGRPVRGSWWGHPLGGRIFQIAEALGDRPDVLVCKLTGGKTAFVHRSLWPALARVVTDPGFRASQRRGLGPTARRLLDDVERRAEVGMNRRRGDKRRLKEAREELEARLLVHGAQMHTARGSHAAVLRSWRSWVTRAVAAAATRLDLNEAKEVLRAACGGRTPWEEP